MDNNELYHHGVLGMKWGKRKNKNTENKDYSGKQRKRDQALYGKKAEKRINKKLNEGHGLQGARHYEVERKEKAEKRKRTAKKGAKAAGRVLSTVGSAYIYDQAFNGGRGTQAVKKGIKTIGRAAISAFTMARGGYDIRWYDN